MQTKLLQRHLGAIQDRAPPVTGSRGEPLPPVLGRQVPQHQAGGLRYLHEPCLRPEGRNAVNPPRRHRPEHPHEHQRVNTHPSF